MSSEIAAPASASVPASARGTTRTEGVISQLRDQVLDGSLAPGTHLHEEALAQRLGVSRTPVRDALRVLANENLLVYAPNRGYVVRAFGAQDILGAYDVRGTLEAMACRLAAERGLSAEVEAALREVLAKSDAIVNGGNWEAVQQQAWQRLNASFHAIVVDYSGNQHLISSARQMRRIPRVYDPRLAPDHSVFQTIYSDERARRSHIEHCEVFDAICNRQGTRAEGLMREHVYRNRELLRQSMSLLENSLAKMSAA